MRKFFGVLILMSAVAVAVQADESSKIRVFIGASGMFNGLEGDWNGDAILSNGVEQVAVPDFGSALGGGLHLGFRRSSSESVDPGLELVYTQTALDGDLAGFDLNGTYRTLGLDAKLFFNTGGENTWQPFLVAGIFLPWLNVEDGAADLSSTGDADFSGIGYNLGGGFSFAMGRQIALDLGAAFRLTEFTSVDGLHGSEQIDEPLESFDFVPSVTLKVFLN